MPRDELPPHGVDLPRHLDLLEEATEEDLDELLEDLFCHAWPTLASQNA
jgi:hypothetical protein